MPNISEKYEKFTELLDGGTPVALTTSWVDVGSTTDKFLDTRGHTEMCVALQTTINGSTDIQIRLVGITEEEGTDEYVYPLRDVASSGVTVYEDKYILNSSVVGKLMLEMALPAAGFTKIQMKVSAVGGSAATIDSLKYSIA